VAFAVHMTENISIYVAKGHQVRERHLKNLLFQLGRSLPQLIGISSYRSLDGDQQNHWNRSTSTLQVQNFLDQIFLD
jgi:hypothetical protein